MSILFLVEESECPWCIYQLVKCVCVCVSIPIWGVKHMFSHSHARFLSSLNKNANIIGLGQYTIHYTVLYYLFACMCVCGAVITCMCAMCVYKLDKSHWKSNGKAYIVKIYIKTAFLICHFGDLYSLLWFCEANMMLKRHLNLHFVTFLLQLFIPSKYVSPVSPFRDFFTIKHSTLDHICLLTP